MSPLVVLILCCHLTYFVQANDVSSPHNRHLLAGIPPQKVEEKHESDVKSKDSPVVIDVNPKPKEEKLQPKPEPEKPQHEKPENKSTSTTQKTIKDEKNVYQTGTAQMESGTLLRGVAVVVALTTLVLIYMALRTYCGGRGKQPAMVRKYGVRTRRSDIEMTPLPLDEDEEDETLFDVNSTHR